jgi:hypothetical protein
MRPAYARTGVAFVLASLLALWLVPGSASAASGSSPIAAAAQKTTQAAAYRSSAKITVFGAPESWFQHIPGVDPTKEIVLLDLQGSYRGADSRVTLKGLDALTLGLESGRAIELVTAGGESYLQGPIESLGATEPVWYSLGAESGWSYDPLMSVISLGTIESGKLSKLRDAKLDGRSCAIYGADKAAALNAIMLLMSPDSTGSELRALLARVVQGSAEIWSCDDGRIHQIDAAFDLNCTCSTDQQTAYVAAPSGPKIANYRMQLRLYDFDASIVIEAPRDAVSLWEAEDTGPSGPQATVFNGGNIRREPNLRGAVLGQLHAGQRVSLLERTADDRWYLVAAPEATGWVSSTLLTLDAGAAGLVPVTGHGSTPAPSSSQAGLTAKVFNGGNLRREPSTMGQVLDQIHAGEVVQLVERTADGNWYRVVNPRRVTGWVHRTLLTVDRAVVDQVPVWRG